MAPNAADDPTAVKPDVLSDEFGFRPEDVVITGFSGRLPECDTIDEFRQKLYAGEDMVNGEPTRWPMGKVCRTVRRYVVSPLRAFSRSVRRHHEDRQNEGPHPVRRGILRISARLGRTRRPATEDVAGSRVRIDRRRGFVSFYLFPLYSCFHDISDACMYESLGFINDRVPCLVELPSFCSFFRLSMALYCLA